MPRPIEFALITDAQCLLPDHNRQTRAALERALAQRGIAVYLNSRVTRVEATQVILGGAAEVIASDATIWATGAGAPSWLADTALALDAQGFIRIDERLASVSNPEIFAAGDCATIEGHRYPKSGVYAVRQGPVLAENLRRVLAGERLGQLRSAAACVGVDQHREPLRSRVVRPLCARRRVGLALEGLHRPQVHAALSRLNEPRIKPGSRARICACPPAPPRSCRR
jgi:selenide,water dikinase